MVALAAPAAAQPATPGPAASTAAGAEALNFNQTQGFAQAEVVLAEGEKYRVFVPLSKYGFADAVPFFRQEEDIVGGMPPLYLSVDKVKTIYIMSTGLFLEHLVVDGKAERVLAAQVLQGAVELFTYAPVDFTRMGPAMYQPQAAIMESQRQWFVRRPGAAVVRVKRGGFVKQMAAYFQDDPVLVETLEDKRMGFEDLRMVVRLYNEHHAAPAR